MIVKGIFNIVKREKCNPFSDVLKCDAFLDQAPRNFIREYNKAFEIILPGANALYSSNDKCVKASLTYNYWGISSRLKSILVLFLIAL